MLAVLLLFSTQVFAENSAYYSTDGQTICVEGQLLQPQSFTDDWVTFILKKKDSEIGEESIGYVGQSYISNEGKYQHKFEFDKNIHDYELYVRAGAEDVTHSVVKATSLSGKIMKCSVQLQNGSCKVTGYPGELLNEQQFLVIVAFYNNDRLVSVDVKEDIYIDEQEGSFEISVDAPDNAQTARAFIWKTLESMVPLGTTSQTIDFGYELEKQDKTGYVPLTGENNYQQYLQAKAELPEEVPVIYPFSINAGTEFYVSPDGNDRNNGTIEAPFKTIQKALSEVACLSDAKKTNSVAIYLREGDYIISKPLELGKSHCDMINNSTLFISSYNNEKVRITNNVTFKGSQFELVTADNTDAQTLARMHESALGNVYVADYDDLGITKMIGFDDNNSGVKNSMYQNEHKLTLARYPNVGYDYVEDVLVDGLNEETLAVWIPEDKQVFTWEDTGKIGIYGMTCAPWITSSGIPTIDADEGTLSITNFSLYQPTGFENRPFSIYVDKSKTIKSHYYYYNVFEELDLPSEWIGDDEAGKLYLYPVDGTLKDDDEIRLGLKETASLVNVNDASNVVFNGLIFENSSTGINIGSSSDIVIQNCELRANNWALYMFDTYKCGIINSEISHSRAGVCMQTNKTKKEFKPCRNFVQNCHFSFIEDTAVEINSPGNIVSHNLMENFEGFGVILQHSENIIEYNELRMGQLQGAEGCGIYVGGGYAYRNNHIRYNYLYDFRSPLMNLQGNLLSSDNCSESTYYYGNILKKGYAAISNNSGDQHIMDGNIIIDSSPTAAATGALFYDMGYLGPHVLNAGMDSGFFSRYKEIGAYESEEWNTRYPNLKARTDWIMQLSEEWNGGKGSAESDDMIFFRSDTGNYYINNIIVNGGLVGPSEKGSNYLAENLNLKDNPNAAVPQHDGESYRDYNVIDNNIELDDFDITSVDYFSNIGMLTTIDSNYDYKNSEIYVLTAEGFTETDTYGLDLAWLGRDDGNYYRVTVASDSDFAEIVSRVDTKPTEPFCSIELPSNGTYYYKIELFSMDDSLSGDAVACSKPCQISIN